MTQVTEALSEYEKERGKPMPSRNHGALELRLGSALLKRYGDTHSIFSEVTLDTQPPMTPDISVFYPKVELDWSRDEVRMAQTPLLVIEILSPAQSLDELVAKTRAYFTVGVRSCWLVLPTYKLIAVHTPDAEPHVFAEGDVVDPMTQLSVTIEEIFK